MGAFSFEKELQNASILKQIEIENSQKVTYLIQQCNISKKPSVGKENTENVRQESCFYHKFV